jgi:hypothetical protein
MPSLNPTAEATLSPKSIGFSRFLQTFHVGNNRGFTDDELGLIQGLYRSYTINFAIPSDIILNRIETTCLVTFQTGLPRPRRLQNLRGMSNYTNRALQVVVVQAVELQYEMEYTSIYTNVSDFPLNFQTYVNDDLVLVAAQLRLLAMNVTVVEPATRLIVVPDPTSAPTTSVAPSFLPSFGPSISSPPSTIPSDIPSLYPSVSTDQPTMEDTTQMPSPSPFLPPTPTPEGTSEPTEGGAGEADTGGVDENTVIVVSIVVAGSIVLIGALIIYRKRKRLRELEFRSSIAGGSRTGDHPSNHEGDWDSGDKNGMPRKSSATKDTSTSLTALQKVDTAASPGREPKVEGVLSPSESLVSNQSLLSAGMDMAGDSGDEADATQGLADEFDQYKDQNLEKMRADVEGSLTGFDGMMSQALTRALGDDDDTNVDSAELIWGGAGNLSGPEIEASALGEVMDWLKRKDTPTVEEK